MSYQAPNTRLHIMATSYPLVCSRMGIRVTILSLRAADGTRYFRPIRNPVGTTASAHKTLAVPTTNALLGRKFRIKQPSNYSILPKAKRQNGASYRGSVFSLVDIVYCWVFCFSIFCRVLKTSLRDGGTAVYKLSFS